tara:strand:+ start:234 stop:410 length:177 start_codon:yes stop_codon:yes gene_type:complete
MAGTWVLALLLSFGLRVWGGYHPSAFFVRPVLVWLLVFAPSILLGIWVSWSTFKNYQN